MRERAWLSSSDAAAAGCLVVWWGWQLSSRMWQNEIKNEKLLLAIILIRWIIILSIFSLSKSRDKEAQNKVELD